MMRQFLLSFTLATVLGVAPDIAPAQPEGIGVGATIGVTNGAAATARNPVGIATKLWLSNRQAITGVTSFFIGGQGRSHWTLQGDYLFHNFNAVSVGEGLMALYIGGGVQYTVFESNPNRGAFRGPTGVTYLLESAPVDLFVEVTPTLQVSDPESLRFDGAVGFRYYFGSSGTDRAN